MLQAGVTVSKVYLCLAHSINMSLYLGLSLKAKESPINEHSKLEFKIFTEMSILNF